MEDILTAFVDGVDSGVNDAIKAATETSTIFISPQINIKLKCSIIQQGKKILVAPSNPAILNQYNAVMDSVMDIELKMRPGKT